jgi:hypothetical protein
MCPMAPDLASYLMRALTLPCILWLRTSPLGWGGLRCYHVSHDFLWAQVLSIKKSLADLLVKLGTLVPNARANVSKKLDIRAIMGLQDVQTDSVVNAYKACGHAATM